MSDIITQYPTEREWDARLMIERSKAIKSPSIHYHLAGTKKVQQELALNGVLERFVKEEDKRSAIKSMFTGLYPLDKVMNNIQGDQSPRFLYSVDSSLGSSLASLGSG